VRLLADFAKDLERKQQQPDRLLDIARRFSSFQGVVAARHEDSFAVTVDKWSASVFPAESEPDPLRRAEAAD
jgi:hypothetical protein